MLPKAVCIYVERAGKILGVSRKDNPNAWGLPGGKVGDDILNETEGEAAIRELKEETGLTLINPYCIFTCDCEPGKDGQGFSTSCWFGKVTGEIQTNESGIVAWITRQDLLDGPFGKYNKKFFDWIDSPAYIVFEAKRLKSVILDALPTNEEDERIIDEMLRKNRIGIKRTPLLKRVK